MKSNYILLLSMVIIALFAAPGLASATGGSSSSPSVTMYSNGSQVGYQLANLTAGNSETLNFSNNTKTTNININFVTPTSVGITANNQTYNLTVGTPVALRDPNSYTGYSYYAELTSISYPSITLLVYGQPPNQPAVSVVSITTTIITPKNITQQKQPITPPAIAVPASTTVAVQASYGSTMVNSNYLKGATILVIVLMLVLMYYSNSRNSSKRKNR